MRILVALWPDAPASVLVAALFHDSGELGSGDIPYPYKSQHPELKVLMDKLESDSLREQGLMVPWVDEIWQWRIKTCDLIEMMEKGMDEVLLGNRFGIPVVRAIEKTLDARLAGHPERCVVEGYLVDRWTRYREAERLA